MVIVMKKEQLLNVLVNLGSKDQHVLVSSCSISKKLFSFTKSDIWEMDVINTFQLNIYDEAFCGEAAIYFRKKNFLDYLRCLTTIA